MRILFERSGGFAAIRLHSEIDSADLLPAEAKKLDSLLRASRFFDIPPGPTSASGGADRFHYRLTVESEEGSRTLEAEEPAIPAAMRPLIEWLTRKAR